MTYSSKGHELWANRLKARIRFALQGSQPAVMDACWALNVVNVAWV